MRTHYFGSLTLKPKANISLRYKADLLNLLNRKARQSYSDTESHSQEGKRTCNETKRSDSSEEGDEILMALNLSESILTKLEEILGKLNNLESKMNAIENTVKNLENAVSKMQKEVAAVQEKNENLTSTVNEMDKGLSFIYEQRS